MSQQPRATDASGRKGKLPPRSNAATRRTKAGIRDEESRREEKKSNSALKDVKLFSACGVHRSLSLQLAVRDAGRQAFRGVSRALIPELLKPLLRVERISGIASLRRYRRS